MPENKASIKDIDTLSDIIRSHIRQHGPMSIDAYMEQCLCHPVHGYYMKKDPFGTKGDFTTAPEISQLFGDVIGLWVMQSYERLGRPPRLTLVECGPGRGTLMADILRMARKNAALYDALDVCLMEISPPLRAAQKQTLTAHGFQARWISQFEEISPNAPVLFLGNEFFDAIGCRQFSYDAPRNQWHERVIGLGDDGDLCFGLSDASWFFPAPKSSLPEPQDGDIFEYAPIRDSLCAAMTRLIARQSGAALFFDYGHTQSGYGDTLQAMMSHQYHSVLDSCGDADITSHVDFAALTNAAHDVIALEGKDASSAITLSTQKNFLETFGIRQWCEKLCKTAPENTQVLEQGLRRLIGETPDQMGLLFKAMQIECNAP